jgi:3-hydroxybutyrate dehydrogenase
VLKDPYVAAKHGVLGLCRAVAKEGASRKVRANAICPGFVMTEMVTMQFPALAAQMDLAEDEVMPRLLANTTVDGEPTLPSDVAQMALYFAAFPTMALTDQSIVVSHGWHME